MARRSFCLKMWLGQPCEDPCELAALYRGAGVHDILGDVNCPDTRTWAETFAENLDTNFAEYLDAKPIFNIGLRGEGSR